MDTIPQDTPQKQCTNADCLQWYPATTQYFSKDSHRNDGLNPYCLVCTRAKWKARNPKKIRDTPEGYKRCKKCNEVHPETPEYFRKAPNGNLHSPCKTCKDEYERVHQEEIAERKRQYYLLHKDEIDARNSQYCRDHPEKMREANERYEKAHPEKARERHKRSYQRHREKRCANQRQWYQTHKLQSHARWLKRQAIKKAIPGILTAQQIQAKLKVQRYACYYCRKKFEKKDGKCIYHIEHTVPLSRTEAGPRHDVNYVVLACPPCNLGKYNKLPHEWPEGGRLF